jgi:HEAT repeat protein
MRFDFLSFLIGFGIAVVLGFILFRLRRQIQTVRQSAETSASSTRRFITNSSEARYYNDLVKMLNAYHLAGDVASLSDLYIEPRFVRAVTPVDPSVEQQNRSVFEVIPVLHEIPASYSAYNIETLRITDLRAGERHLALLGLPGTGKSTALAILGLYASNEISFETLDLASDGIFEDEIKDLPEDEKKKLVEQRKELQRRAVEQLKLAQSRKQEETGIKQRTVVDFQQLLPILVHLRDIDLRPEAYGAQATASGDANKPAPAKPKALDPAEPIVRALQRRFNPITASTLPQMVYRRLTQGTCLVLIDGYDDLAPSERNDKIVWLKQFISMYSGNFIVVTGPVEGYDKLLNTGLTPVFLRAWTEPDFQQLVARWAVAWPMIAGTPKRPAPLPEERIVRRVATGNRNRTPMDVTLKAWAAFSGDEQESGRRGWYDFYVRHELTNADQRPVMEKIAAQILNQGGAPVTRDQIKMLVAPPTADGKPASNADELASKISSQSGLLVDWPDGRYGITQTQVEAYLAGETLLTADAPSVLNIVNSPQWQSALTFASGKLNLTDAVNMRLSAAPDLLYTSLFSIVDWLHDAPPTASWRAEVFKRLTAALLAPSQYPVIRERAMAAMVASRDKNVMFILRQALRATDPNVRRLGCVGMGALGETDAIKDLGEMLTDPDPDVQMAAGQALGAIGTEAALETMLNGLVDGEQALRQAVAESLAAVPGEGHAVLRDAITSNDMMVRRAAVFGLSRIKSAWALSLLYRALLEDEQWYVRNAAEQAFLEAEGLETGGATKHPEADSLAWLIAWAAQKGEGIPAGMNARQSLIRVMQEGDAPLRAAAAVTLANLGHVQALKPLYGALRDRDEKVRGSVYKALTTLQTRMGEKLPAVV